MVFSWTPRSGIIPEKGLFIKGVYKYSVSVKNELKAPSTTSTTTTTAITVSVKNELKEGKITHEEEAKRFCISEE